MSREIKGGQDFIDIEYMVTKRFAKKLFEQNLKKKYF